MRHSYSVTFQFLRTVSLEVLGTRSPDCVSERLEVLLFQPVVPTEGTEGKKWNAPKQSRLNSTIIRSTFKNYSHSQHLNYFTKRIEKKVLYTWQWLKGSLPLVELCTKFIERNAKNLFSKKNCESFSGKIHSGTPISRHWSPQISNWKL